VAFVGVPPVVDDAYAKNANSNANAGANAGANANANANANADANDNDNDNDNDDHEERRGCRRTANGPSLATAQALLPHQGRKGEGDPWPDRARRPSNGWHDVEEDTGCGGRRRRRQRRAAESCEGRLGTAAAAQAGAAE